MAYTTIDDPSVYFQTVLYTGTGSSQNITNDGNSDLKPDWLWIKKRNPSATHYLFDSTRGVDQYLRSDSSAAEDSSGGGTVDAFLTDGFTVDTAGEVNGNTNTFVAWQWKANGGSRTTFTESGNNPGGGYQANTTAGFSIVDHTGTGSAGTVSHGLGATPHWIIVKRRNASSSWIVYHHKNTSEPETDILELQASNATYDNSTYWNDTAPTSSVFTVNTSSDGNADGATYISYVFTEIQGYSKFGSYTGNGNADGPFVYTGFKPAWLMVKNIADSSRHWQLMDNKRSTTNEIDAYLQANADGAEATGSSQHKFDFLSNGFKLRGTADNVNDSGDTHVYMAFAEHPFVSSKGVPTTAR